MKLKKYQKYLLLTMVITIGVTMFYSIQNSFSDQLDKDFLPISILFTILVSISIILVNFPIFEKIKNRFPLNKKLFKGIVVGFLITSFTAAAIITIWVMAFYLTVNRFFNNHFIEEFGLAYVIFNHIVTAVIVNLFIGTFSIIKYSNQEWRKAIVEAEEFKRQGIESQYASLINQINPHFLFNSLNALASLIPQSPEKAVEFVNKFSKIYRYVLDAKDKIVCELKEEIDFLDSYFYLQKIRFGDSLIIEKVIDYECLSKFLPALSLQILVENAIKHNEISKANPLKIKIYTSNPFIVVENSLMLKSVDKESTGIGLKNLIGRYGHLSDLKPEFMVKDTVYIARLPLINEE